MSELIDILNFDPSFGPDYLKEMEKGFGQKRESGSTLYGRHGLPFQAFDHGPSWATISHNNIINNPGAGGQAPIDIIEGETSVGITGPTGPQGFRGPIGPGGPFTPGGVVGATGGTGRTGEIGPEGARGQSGEIGNPGLIGETGSTGPQGVGYTGSTGEVGLGRTGPAGDIGTTGSTGPTGETGSTGPIGAGLFGDCGCCIGDEDVWVKFPDPNYPMTEARANINGRSIFALIYYQESTGERHFIDSGHQSGGEILFNDYNSSNGYLKANVTQDWDSDDCEALGANRRGIGNWAPDSNILNGYGICGCTACDEDRITGRDIWPLEHPSYSYLDRAPNSRGRFIIGEHRDWAWWDGTLSTSKTTYGNCNAGACDMCNFGMGGCPIACSAGEVHDCDCGCYPLSTILDRLGDGTCTTSNPNLNCPDMWCDGEFGSHPSQSDCPACQLGCCAFPWERGFSNGHDQAGRKACRGSCSLCFTGCVREAITLGEAQEEGFYEMANFRFGTDCCDSTGYDFHWLANSFGYAVNTVSPGEYTFEDYAFTRVGDDGSTNCPWTGWPYKPWPNLVMNGKKICEAFRTWAEGTAPGLGITIEPDYENVGVLIVSEWNAMKANYIDGWTPYDPFPDCGLGVDGGDDAGWHDISPAGNLMGKDQVSFDWGEWWNLAPWDTLDDTPNVWQVYHWCDGYNHPTSGDWIQGCFGESGVSGGYACMKRLNTYLNETFFENDPGLDLSHTDMVLQYWSLTDYTIGSSTSPKGGCCVAPFFVP